MHTQTQRSHTHSLPSSPPPAPLPPSLPLGHSCTHTFTRTHRYAGRTELPDNLKVLFRPVACMVPNYALIGEIRLFSFGFKDPRNLAEKMVICFQPCTALTLNPQP